jgi:hypothetical protein
MEVARRMAIAMGIPSNQIINKESSAHGLDHLQATRTFESINNTKIGRYKALQQTMLHVMQNPQFAHPIYLAPYALVGECAR